MPIYYMLKFNLMKRVIISALFMFFTFVPSMAENVMVESMGGFAEKEDIYSFKAKVVEDAIFESGLVFEKDAVVEGEIVKTVDPKRGKRNGYIIIRPISYSIPSEDNEIKKIEDEFLEAKVVGYSKKNFAKMGLNAGLTVGGYYVKGLGQIFYFSKGLIKPDKGRNRIQSAFHNVYENTPFVFLEKGEEVDIEEGDLLVLKFYHADIPKWRFIKRQK